MNFTNAYMLAFCQFILINLDTLNNSKSKVVKNIQ